MLDSKHTVGEMAREGSKSGTKQRKADSTSNAVEYCKEILATIRELKGLDFYQQFLWVRVLNAQKILITLLKEMTLTRHSFSLIT